MREPFTKTLSQADSTKTERVPALQTWDRGDSATPYEPQLDGYVVRKAIGNGGMGWVYEALDPALSRLVAVKVMTVRSHLPELRARFAQEARILARLSHPNIVPVYHVGETKDGRLYYAMKLVPTGTLSETLDALRKDTRRAVRVLVRVARAVQHLHDKGIWHRDLKPSNVLMDDAVEPLVADFGVAKWCEGDESTVGFMRVGTFAYMAPEVVTHGSIASGPKSDLWSLGVMAYELLGGRRPFAGTNNDPDLPHRVCHEEPAALRGHPDAAAEIDDALEAVVAGALRKDPAERYTTAGQFADDLENWLAGQAIRGVRRAKSRSRLRWVVAAVAVLGVAALAAAGVPKLFRDKANAPKTLAEMLEANGKVVVVNEKGETLFPVHPLGQNAGLTSQPGGYLQMDSATTVLAEISNTHLPHPVLFSADVELLTDSNLFANAGIYCRRSTQPGRPNTGPINVFVANRICSKPLLGVGGRIPGEATFGAFLNYTGDPASQLVPTPNYPNHNVACPPGPGTVHHLSLVIDPKPGRVKAITDKQEYAPTCYDILEFESRESFRQMHLTPAEPLFGDGIGLYVHRCTAAFRNVVIERIDP